MKEIGDIYFFPLELRRRWRGVVKLMLRLL